MKLENLRIEEHEDRRRVAADVVWETAERPNQILSFEVPYPFAADLQPSPNAFLLASLPFAVWWGESRIRVEGSLCARFKDNLQAVMAIYAHWFERCRPLTIEPLGGYVATQPRADARTASFLSGGVDGLAVLRANRLDYPLEHPESIRECLLLFGANDFECTPEGPVPGRLEAFRRLEGRLVELGRAENFQLIPVLTNTRLLAGDYACWTSVGYGAANVAVAHALSGRFTKVLFASDGNGVDASPGASRPLLDQYFSSAAVQVQHEQASWTRRDKLRLLGEWPAGLRLMQPCHYIRVPPAGQINCGRCEKCIRTMLGLITLGKLAEASAFVEDDVTPEMIRPVGIFNQAKSEMWEQLVEPLRAVGREDLARAIQRKLFHFRWRKLSRHIYPKFVRDWKNSLVLKRRSR